MIKEFKFEKKKTVNTSDPLPAGGYVAKIMGAELIKYDWGDVLKLSFDIAEGEQKEFFAMQYRGNTNEDKKWKGTFRITIPNEESEYFESQLKTWSNFIACMEESNAGYIFDWDEAKFKNKLIGVLFRNKEWEYNNMTGWTTECCAVRSAIDIREGNFKIPRDKPLKNRPSSAGVSGFTEATAEDDDDLPF